MCGRTFIARTTPAKRGRKSCREFRTGKPSTWSGKIRKRKGLLFAGTERAVYVSFDDGDNWQSLRLNMPATSVRDLIIKDDDVAVATHGRGFWILDNITPLRQLTQRPTRFRSCSNRRLRFVFVGISTPIPRSRLMSRPAKIRRMAQ